MSETHERNGYPREIEEDSPPSPPPSLERLAHQVREERTERLRQHGLQQHQIAGLATEIGELSGLVRNSEEARAEDMRAIRRALGDLSEGQGRIAAELGARARQDSLHEEAITGVHKAVKATDAALDVTRRDLAVARAKWLGWRSLAAGLGWGALEALKHWIGG